MQFGLKTGREAAGEYFTKVETIVIETGSVVPRTNRRKLRAFCMSYLGIYPRYVKMFMKQQQLWTSTELGLTPEQREQLYKEAREWQSKQTA